MAAPGIGACWAACAAWRHRLELAPCHHGMFALVPTPIALEIVTGKLRPVRALRHREVFRSRRKPGHHTDMGEPAEVGRGDPAQSLSPDSRRPGAALLWF